MRKIESDRKEIKIKNTWEPTELFSNSEIAKIYSKVPDNFDIVFGDDLIKSETRSIYIIPRGSAEMTWVQIDCPGNEYYAMNLAPNELFDPKDEGIIYIQPDTHDELRNTILKISEVLYKKYSEESV